MHTARQLHSSQFRVTHLGRSATREDLLPDWTPFDRLGVIVTEPFGALGASHLIQLAITAFYDARPTRRAGRAVGDDPRAIYPEIFLFHVGGAHGDHSAFDFWPARKEVFVQSDARLVLDAINDRAITRLAVPDKDFVKVAHEHKEPAAARDRIATALAYCATGRVRRADWEITGCDRRTEANVTLVLDPDKRYAGAGSPREAPKDALLAQRSWELRTVARRDEGRLGLEAARRRREAIRDTEGLARESYRALTVDEALGMLI
jgi:hypothetical protein